VCWFQEVGGEECNHEDYNDDAFELNMKGRSDYRRTSDDKIASYQPQKRTI
jgi:hypothetical protein